MTRWTDDIHEPLERRPTPPFPFRSSSLRRGGHAVAMSAIPDDAAFQATRLRGLLSDRVAAALAAARSYVLSIQEGDGHWCGDLEGGPVVESGELLALFLL